MKKYFFIPLALLILLSFSCMVFAVDPAGTLNTAEAYTLKEHSPLATIGYFFQVLLSLIVVFVLIYIAYKYLLPKLKLTSQGKLIEIVDRVGLEPGISAYIIKVKNRSWLVMASNKTIEKIDEIEESSSS